MNAPDCICSPGRLPLGAFCAGRDDLEREALHDDRISIRAPRAGCDFLRLQDIARALISIHAPRVGRDCIPLNPAEQPENFNPRAPCGARPSARSKKSLLRAFQSTRPVWGATLARLILARPIRHFNPRAPCGARPYTMPSPSVLLYFNPRAPCGARPMPPRNCSRLSYFNPRAPCGARRGIRFPAARPQDFNPRAPCGARPRIAWYKADLSLFQSTRPVWGATMCFSITRGKHIISIHAPRVGRDATASTRIWRCVTFQSTRPVWGATISLLVTAFMYL